MLNGIFTAPRCRGNAPQAPSRRTAGVACWLAATGLAAGLPAVAATPIPVVSAVPYRADSGSVAVQCGRLIDGVAARAQGLATVVIRSGRVDSVQPGAVSPAGMPVRRPAAIHLPARPDRHAHAPDGQPARDGRPQRLLHAHAGGAGRDRAGKRPRRRCWPGSPTVRDVGTYIAWVDRDLRDAINRGRRAGPRMQVAGYYLTIPGGGGDLVIPGHAEVGDPAAGAHGRRARARAVPAARPSRPSRAAPTCSRSSRPAPCSRSAACRASVR